MAKFAVADVDAVLFQTTLRVQVGDVNYGGHLANDAVLRLCHEVRMRWLAGLGWSETDAGAQIIGVAAILRLARAVGHDGQRPDLQPESPAPARTPAQSLAAGRVEPYARQLARRRRFGSARPCLV